MMPRVLLAGCAALGGCGLFVDHDDTAFEGCDIQVSDYWPFQPEASYPPGGLVKVPRIAGASYPDGFGEVVLTDLVWAHHVHVAHTPDEAAVIALPMEPGAYVVRRQSPYCVAQGMDHTLVVERPPTPDEVPVPAITGPDALAFAADASPDGGRYAGVVSASPAPVLVEVETSAQTPVAWACPAPCRPHVAYSPTGTYLAQGHRLFDRSTGTLLTQFQDEAGEPLDVRFLPWDDELLLRGDDGLVTVFDLATSARTPLLVATDPRILVAGDGLLLADGTLYDLDTLGIAGTGLGAWVRHWDPATNRAVVTDGFDSPTLNLAQVFPAELLGPWGGPCVFTYLDVQVAVDPLGRGAVAWGARNPGAGSDNPWIQTCSIDLASGTLGPRADVPFPYPADADLQRTHHAAYSADGSLLVLAGLGGLTALPVDAPAP